MHPVLRSFRGRFLFVPVMIRALACCCFVLAGAARGAVPEAGDAVAPESGEACPSGMRPWRRMKRKTIPPHWVC